MDGLELIPDIRKISDIPIIMLTGKGSYFDKIKGTMAGANLYLTKPVEQEQLKEVINEYLPNLN